MALSCLGILTDEEIRRHAIYKQGYDLFKGKPKHFSSSSPYPYDTLEIDLWRVGAHQALEEDRGRNTGWQGGRGVPLSGTPIFVQLDLFGD
jgi:hypothetical protein